MNQSIVSRVQHNTGLYVSVVQKNPLLKNNHVKACLETANKHNGEKSGQREEEREREGKPIKHPAVFTYPVRLHALHARCTLSHLNPLIKVIKHPFGRSR